MAKRKRKARNESMRDRWMSTRSGRYVQVTLTTEWTEDGEPLYRLVSALTSKRMQDRYTEADIVAMKRRWVKRPPSKSQLLGTL